MVYRKYSFNKSVNTHADVKGIKLTGNPLEFILLTYHGNIGKGVANHNGIVKKNKIGQSAGKYPYEKDKPSETLISPNYC